MATLFPITKPVKKCVNINVDFYGHFKAYVFKSLDVFMAKDRCSLNSIVAKRNLGPTD